MRVLFVSQYYWPEGFQINHLAEGLAARDHDVTVLTGMPNYPAGKRFENYGVWSPKREQHNGVNIVRLPIITRGNNSRLRLVLNYFSYAFSGVVFGGWLCRDDYDVILVNGVSPITQAIPAMWLRRWRDIPVVYYVLDLWPESVVAVDAVRSKFLLSALRKFVRWIYNNCDTFLISSKPFKNRLIEQGVASDSIAYLPNSADVPAEVNVTQTQMSAELNVPTGFWVMYAGNVGKTQSVPTVLEAARHCRDQPSIKFVIVGDGRVRETMQQQAKAEGLDNVYFVGRFPPEDMPRFFAAANALMVTLRDVPIFSLTVPARVQSFLAAGKPIISACGDAGADVVRIAKAGLVVQPEDGKGLANAIIQLSKLSDDERLAMGENGKHYFLQHFTHQRVVDQLEEYLSKVAAKSALTAPVF